MVDVPILFQDDDLLVVDKPAGVLVVPAPGRRGATVVDLVTAQLGQRVEAVHRLDEETTGALVLARTPAARTGMEDLFRRHAVERDYLALVNGVPSPPAGRIEARLRENDQGSMEVVRSGGETAITHYRTLHKVGRCALVLCRLETGRRNQIRAHLAALGCPIAGDRKYGFRGRDGERFRRVMLHSWRIRFRHPLRGSEIALVVAAAEPELTAEPDA